MEILVKGSFTGTVSTELPAITVSNGLPVITLDTTTLKLASPTFSTAFTLYSLFTVNKVGVWSIQVTIGGGSFQNLQIGLTVYRG